MLSAAVQQSLHLLDFYPTVAIEASNRARHAPGMDALRFGVQLGEINLEQLQLLPLYERQRIVELGPYIDIYLGETRVYKLTSRTLLFASCPDVARILGPVHGRLAVRLPQRLTNALTVKPAILYMEQYFLDPRIRSAPWKVNDDFATYISLAKLFAYIGMPHAEQAVEMAVMRRIQEAPLRVRQMRQIWMREITRAPSRYAESLADKHPHVCLPSEDGALHG
jgi:hypothetical protein